MKIEIKKVSFSERMSEETNCFVADLYINGKNVGTCKNDGHGGCTDYHGYTKENIAIIKEAETYCKALPKVKSSFDDFEYEQSLEGVIDEQLEAHLKAKEMKKMTKLFATAIVFGTPDGSSCGYQKYKLPLETISKMPNGKIRVQATIEEIKRDECKNGVIILNDNLVALGWTI